MGELSLDRRINILVRALEDSAKTCWNGSWKLGENEDQYKGSRNAEISMKSD